MLSVLLLLFLCVCGSGLQIVETSHGKLRGISDFSNKDNHKHMFKGIPFAAPPVGKLRFEKPQEPEPWDGVLDASTYKSACMQNSSKTVNSEDCLYINIFTSDRCLKSKNCSVIVFIHGGSFNYLSATSFPDNFILERYVEEDIVFAIPAFRLGVFGQYWLGEWTGTSPNLLLFDCVKGLEYVNREIHAFGGNPNAVTLFGHSSGGSIVNSLAFSHEIDPDMKLFQQVLVLSAHGYYGLDSITVHNSYEISVRFGCDSGSVQDVLNCMRQVDAVDLLNEQINMELNDYLYFKSILLREPIVKEGEIGKVADLKRDVAPRNLLYGVTEYEFESFNYVNYYVTGYFMDFENPYETIMAYRDHVQKNGTEWVNSDSSSVYLTAETYCEATVKAGANVWLYETRQKPYTMHTSDMQFFIGIHKEPVHYPDMDILDTFYSKLLVNFTKYGEPSPTFDKFDPTKKNYLALEIDTKLGIEPEMQNGFHEELIDFWLTNMTLFDKKVSVKKHLNPEDPLTPEPPQRPSENTEKEYTTSEVEVNTESVPASESPAESSESSEPVIEEGSSAIYSQWWFYGIIILGFIVLIFVCIVLRRSTKEQQPLLG